MFLVYACRADGVNRLSIQVLEIDELVQLMENEIEKENVNNKSSDKMVITLNVANHVLHITQGLTRPRGHVFLVGYYGCGRRSCARLSALLLKYEVFQVSCHIFLRLPINHYFMIDFLCEIFFTDKVWPELYLCGVVG